MYFIVKIQTKVISALVRVTKINMLTYKNKLGYRLCINYYTSYLVTLFPFNLQLMPPSGVIWFYNLTVSTSIMISPLKKTT